MAPIDPRSSVSPDVFYGSPPPPAQGAPSAFETLPRDPRRHAAILAGIGLLGTIVLGADFLRQVVVGAPLFEELLKFGLALLLVTMMRVRSAPLRVLVALLPGAGFGAFEHAFTYASEPLLVFADRVVFHAGSTALSMAVYHAIEPVPDARLLWFAPLPSMLVHWANNFLAVVLGVGSLVGGFDGTALGLTVGFTLGILAHVATWATLVAQTRVRELAWREWTRRGPGARAAGAVSAGARPGADTGSSAGTGPRAAQPSSAASTPGLPEAHTGEGPPRP